MALRGVVVAIVIVRPGPYLMGKTLYEILESLPNASFEQIKENYRRLLIRNHPDKAGEDKVEFMQTIQFAWETLRDDAKRLEYDERLLILENDKKNCVYDEVSFSEFEQVISGQKGFRLHCRCGGEFFIGMDDLCKGFNLISCSNCTARVLIK